MKRQSIIEAFGQYQLIIDVHSDGIYIDEHCIMQLKFKILQLPEKAKPLYEKLI
jgi:hypothetical protein